MSQELDYWDVFAGRVYEWSGPHFSMKPSMGGF